MSSSEQEMKKPLALDQLTAEDKETIRQKVHTVSTTTGVVAGAIGFGLAYGAVRLLNRRDSYFRNKVPPVAKRMALVMAPFFFFEVGSQEGLVRYTRALQFSEQREQMAQMSQIIRKERAEQGNMLDRAGHFVSENSGAVFMTVWAGTLAGYFAHVWSNKGIALQMKMIHSRIFAQTIGLSGLALMAYLLPKNSDRRAIREAMDNSDTRFDYVLGPGETQTPGRPVYGPRFT